MADVDGEEPIGGFGRRVEIDETFVGGVVRTDQNRRSLDNKTIVFGMSERGGDLVTKVIPDRKSGTLLPIVKATVKPHTEVHTDEWLGYGALGTMGYWHKSVNHAKDQYVSATGTTVNAIEGFWRHFKSSIAGTHVSVSPKYLGRYAKEFEYRFNRRDDAASMLPELLSTFGPLKPTRG